MSRFRQPVLELAFCVNECCIAVSVFRTAATAASTATGSAPLAGGDGEKFGTCCQRGSLNVTFRPLPVVDQQDLVQGSTGT